MTGPTDLVEAGPILRIVIPAKDEEVRIERTVADFCMYFESRATVLVVANACSDRTAERVRTLCAEFPNLELLEIAAPIGKGGAVRAGLTIGAEPYLAFVDADGSTRPDQLDVLLGRCKRYGLSGVIGSRWMRGSTISRRQPLQRRIASRAFNLLVRVMFGLPYTDTQCGAKVFERAAIDCAFHQLELANFAFDVDLLVTLRRLRRKVVEIPIAWGDVPDYSKVMVLRSDSSMLLALVRLWIRDSVFRHLPWTGLLARSSVIPVKFGLKFLVLCESAVTGDAGNPLLDEICRQGHEVHVTRICGPADTLRFARDYVRYGHRRYDVIVDLLAHDGSPLSGFSTKPKIYPSSMEALTASEIASLVENAARQCGYNAYFWPFEKGWMLSSSRAESVLQESR